MSTRQEREALAKVQELGLTILHQRQGKHLVLRLQNAHGVVGSFILARGKSTSTRNDDNRDKRFARFAACTSQQEWLDTVR